MANPVKPTKEYPDNGLDDGLPDEEEELESDEYDSALEDEEGGEVGEVDDEDDGEIDDDEEGDEEEAAEANGGLTHLLLAENQGQDGDGAEDEDEDDGYIPEGGYEPADDEVDGDAREDDVKLATGNGEVTGLKRSRDEDEEDEPVAASVGQEAKRTKV